MKNKQHRMLPDFKPSVLMLAALMLISFVFLYFGSMIDTEIEIHTRKHIEEYATQQKTYISEVLESRYSLLNAFATHFQDELLEDTDEFCELVHTLLLTSDFDHILTIDRDGYFRIDTGEFGQGTNDAGRQVLLSSEESLSRPFSAFFHNDELCVLLSVPLHDEAGQPTGMLCAAYTAQRFGRLLLQENYRDSAYSLLTDANGQLLFSSSSDNLFIPDQSSDQEKRMVPSPTFFDEKSSAAVRESMARREDNLYTVSHSGVDYVVVQTPLEQNNWLLFCMTPTDSIAANYVFITELLRMQMVAIIAIIIVAAIVVILMLMRDWRRLRRENTVLSVRAKTDSMTGLLNQATTSSTISAELLEHAGEGLLLLIDLDNLKSINDTMGHPIGDRAILLLSELMQRIFSDAKVIGRIGGDEFMIYMSRPGSREEVRAQILQLQEDMRHSLISRADMPKEVPLHCSIGVAYARAGDDYHSLYSRADIALYHVKRRGKDGYSFFEDIA
ncbi:MAG: diguanylate cyclase [Clostridia bacterium]|nr:diguanylate cyclase [Clostridia bacterium]